ncbi:MAG: hypothetical protein M1839_002182 [Geoglossum umbratile]|nr:MAG: hypothetical protein M1839_002182 [Geoglossum umbratile]
MARLRLPRLKFWPNHVRPFDHLDTLELRRAAVYALIDDSGFGWWIVFVAGVGFLTDAYDIFAVNMVLPMLSIVFWNGNIPLSVTTVFNSITLLGMVIGQVVFGVLADRYGRKKMYGLELLVVIFSTLGVALASRGSANSIHIVGWLVFWRLLMGFGIGGDYPLSAVITAEFAPRKRRARMLAAVFFMQPIGQLIANIVAVIATAAYHRHIIHNADPQHCIDECMQTTDKIWRWVVGFGAIPPAIAVVFRLYIPESPRYMLEVEMDSVTAVQDSNWYYGSQSSVSVRRGDIEAKPAMTAQPAEVRTTALPVPPGSLGYADSSTQVSSDATKDEITAAGPPAPPPKRQSSLSIHSIHSSVSSIVPDPSPEPTHKKPEKRPKAKKPTWTQYRKGLYKYLFIDDNWTDLAGTATTWLLLDFSFYFLGVNSSSIVAKIWGTSDSSTVYEVLMQNGWRALITNSIGAMVGGAIMIAVVRWRRNVQTYGFLILGGLFFAVGFTFVYLLHTRFLGAIIVLYVLCQLFFNLGPNTTTFMIPAEVFPTQYRGTCHGLSAAAGKVGSILAQIFLAYVKFGGKGVSDDRSTWLGWILVIFTFVMACGAAITYFWVPNPCDIRGSSRSLEVLALGKAHRKMLEEAEKRAEAAVS